MTLVEDALASHGAENLYELAQLIAETRIEGASDIEDFHTRKNSLAKELETRMAKGETVDEDYALPNPPKALQAYLKQNHGIETPLRASDFLRYPAANIDDTVTDPFAMWIEATMPEPTQEALDRIDELSKMAEEAARDFEAGPKPSLWDRVLGVFGR